MKQLNSITKTALISTVFLLAAHTTAMAADHGLYLNLNMGYGTVDYNSITDGALASGFTVPTDTTTDNSGFTLNANMGYLFVPYFGVEAGYTLLPSVATSAQTAEYSSSLSSSYVDLALKGILPFSNGLQLFAKAGVAYLFGTDQVTDDFDMPCSDCYQDLASFAPLFAIGAGYSFTPNWTISVTETMTLQTDNTCSGFFKGGPDCAFSPATYTTTVGLTYLF